MDQSLAAAAFDLLDDGIALFDAEDRLIHCNGLFRAMHLSLEGVALQGITYAQLLRRLVESGEIAGKLAAACPEEWLHRRLELHRACTGASEHQLTDGRWLRVVERRLPSGGVMTRWTDVTAAKRTAFQLEDIHEATADGFALWDQAGRLVRCNSRFADHFAGIGGPPQPGGGYRQILEGLALSGRLCLSVPAADWVARQQARRRLPVSEDIVEFADGRHLMLRERRIRDGGWAMVLTDITQLKRHEQELRRKSESLERAMSEMEAGRQALARMASEIAAARDAAEASSARLREADAQQRAILETMADALLTIDEFGTIRSLNPAAERIFGYKADEVIGRNIALLMPDDYARAHGDHLEAYRLTGQRSIIGTTRERAGRRKSGEVFPIELSVGEVGDGGRKLFVGTIRDITQRKRAEAALRESEARLRVIAANVPGVIYQWALRSDGSQRFSYVSEKSQEIFGIPAADLMRDPDLFAIHPEDRDRWAESVAQALMESRDWSFEGRVILPSGELRWWRGVASPLLTGTEELLLNGVMVDITRQKQLEQELRILATTDFLTGALNRRAFMDGLNRAAARFERGHGIFSVLIADIDHFKKINDSHGHAIGDEALKAFMAAAKAALRKEDVLGRLGGEEFAVILAGDDALRARDVAERLREAIGAIRLPLPEGGILRFTVSIGVTDWRTGDNPDTVLARADDALYRAKQSGRNRVILAGAEESAAP